MRGNRLAFAVRVRRQEHRIALGRQLLQPVHHLLLARRHNQRRLKRPPLQLHTNIVLRQVHDVADRGLHHVVAAEIFPDRLRLRGRLYDHKILCHLLPLLRPERPLPPTFNQCQCTLTRPAEDKSNGRRSNPPYGPPEPVVPLDVLIRRKLWKNACSKTRQKRSKTTKKHSKKHSEIKSKTAQVIFAWHLLHPACKLQLEQRRKN